MFWKNRICENLTLLIWIKLILLTDEEKSHISLVQDKKIMNYRRNA